MGRLDGKIALVTGGASGLGRATADLFAREGARVVVTDVDVAAGQLAASAIGETAIFLEHDVGDEPRWQQVIEAASAHFGGLDVLVNNAGVEGGAGPASDPERTELESFRNVQRVNVEGVFLGCKHAIPAIRQRGGGSIVNLSSIAALVATPFITAYGASKAAVQQLSRSVALHCAQSGDRIRCNSVHPGQITTPMLDRLFDDVSAAAASETERTRAEFRRRIPLGEFGEPDDVAYAILYLASDESKHVTGTSLIVDGGMSLNP